MAFGDGAIDQFAHLFGDYDYEYDGSDVYESQQPQRRTTRKEQNMKTTGKALYLQERIRMLEAQLEDEMVKEMKFKFIRDLKDGAMITWDQQFTEGGLTYTFIAFKAQGHWYTSKLVQRIKMTTDELIENHLQHAEEGSLMRLKRKSF